MSKNPIPQGKYKPAVRYGNLIFTAGMTPRKDGVLLMSGKISPDRPLDEYRDAVIQAASNALTAAQDSLERWMELATAVRNGYQVVVVENSCDRPPVEGEDGLRTTKKERELHGFGLKSVAKALKKYQGDFQWEYDGEKRHFIMTVMVGQSEEKEERLDGAVV